MATKPAKKALAVKTTGTSLANIDAELQNEIANIKETIGQSSGNRLKLEVTGDWTLPDGANLGNEIQVVVIDYASRNNFYLTNFDRDNPTPPDCYAMGKKIADMAPEDDSPEKQSDKCGTCPMNQFGSGQNGKSKACQNRRYAAVLLVDPENDGAHNEPDAPIYLIDLSPSNIKSFDGAVGMVARSLNGPPIKAILTVVGKNAGTYATATWIDPVPNPDYAQHVARRAEVQDLLYRKPDFAAHEAKQQQQKPARGRGASAPRRAVGNRR